MRNDFVHNFITWCAKTTWW